MIYPLCTAGLLNPLDSILMLLRLRGCGRDSHGSAICLPHTRNTMSRDDRVAPNLAEPLGLSDSRLAARRRPVTV